jgi:L-iditol 2-dehydrogenase
MKAVVKYATGVGNVGVRDMPEPSPQAGQVKIEVKAAGVCGTDIHIFYDEYKTTPPIILGHELAGVVAEVGAGVTTCRVGDRVTSETYFDTCGVCRYCRNGKPNLCGKRRSIGSIVNGAMTKYVIVPEVNVHLLPENVDFQAGALTEPLTCVVHGGLIRTKIMPGDVVLVSGPGTIGLLAMQVAKAAQATVVVSGLSQDEKRLELGLELGADRVVNVEKEDLFQVLNGMTDGYGPDVVFECAGAGPSAAMCLKAIRKGGQYTQMGLAGKSYAWDMDLVAYKEIQMTGMFATIPEAWTKALQLMAAGLVNTKPLASHVLPVTEWEKAFQMFKDKVGYKIILEPVD